MHDEPESEAQSEAPRFRTPVPRPLTPELRETFRAVGMTADEMRMACSGDFILILDELMPQLLPRLVLCRRAQCRRRNRCVPRFENDIGACLVVLENRANLHRRETGKVTPWGRSPEALAQFEAETLRLTQELKEAELAVWGAWGPPTAAERRRRAAERAAKPVDERRASRKGAHAS